jgi:hypothetical protein
MIYQGVMAMRSNVLKCFWKVALAVVFVTGCGGPEQVATEPSREPDAVEALAESEWCPAAKELLKSGWVVKKADGQVEALYAGWGSCPKGMDCTMATCADGCH